MKILWSVRLQRRGRTTFISAHRLAAVHNADHILVDQSRRMMESGIPEELLDQKRTYADLVRFQNR